MSQTDADDHDDDHDDDDRNDDHDGAAWMTPLAIYHEIQSKHLKSPQTPSPSAPRRALLCVIFPVFPSLNAGNRRRNRDLRSEESKMIVLFPSFNRKKRQEGRGNEWGRTGRAGAGQV